MLNANAERWIVQQWQKCIEHNEPWFWSALESQLLALQICTTDVEESLAYQLMGGVAAKREMMTLLEGLK